MSALSLKKFKEQFNCYAGKGSGESLHNHLNYSWWYIISCSYGYKFNSLGVLNPVK